MKFLKHITFFLSITLFAFACNKTPSLREPSDNPTITAMYIMANDSAPEASSAFFTIDNEKDFITNMDSLPYGTRIDSLYLGFYFASSYGFVMNDTVSEASTITQGKTSRYYDLTKPVKIKNLATDGKTTKEYTISVNVHQVEPYLHVWNQLTPQVMENAPKNQKAVLLNNAFYYFFGNDAGYSLYTSTNANGWTKTATPTGLSAKLDLRNMLVYNNAIYLLNNNTLYSTTDGISWQSATVSGDSNYRYDKLLFTFKDKMWATVIANDDTHLRIANSTDGVNWTFSGNRIFTENFPASAFAATGFTPPVGREKVIVVGGKSLSGKILSSIWSAENIPGTDTLNWINLQRSNKVVNNIADASVAYYGSKLLLLGGEVVAGNLVPDTLQLIESRNEGLTWKIPNKSQNILPAEFTKRKNASFIEDSNNHSLYILGGHSGTNTLSDSWKIKVNFYDFADYKTNPSKY